MAPRVSFLALGVVTLVFLSSIARAQHLPPPAYQWAATAADIPANILFAVALQESGMLFHGRITPWPWTLNVAGTPSRYATRREACTALQSALKRVPATRVDVGLGQLNVGYHGSRVTRPCQLLLPQRNLAIAATILRENHAAGEDWLIAIGRYHRPAGGAPAARYRRSVQRRLWHLFDAGHATLLSRSNPP